ncbi:hypothetical protein GCM10023340_18060 [Nocardioides marinquilinus]|uniref:Uncharacterized protein n=1 Tax=Nocardioides marinquilinus TaxID=1210400 RepID=A0ABP9PKS7_9ACTN
MTPTSRSFAERERSETAEAGLGLLMLWLGPVAAFVIALLWGW